MRSQMLWRVIVLWGLALFPLFGTPITYTMTGNVSGSIGSTQLSNAPFTFVFSADTGGIFTWTDGYIDVLMNPASSTSILLSGSSGGFTEPVIVGVNAAAGIVGFADPNNTKGLTFYNAGAIDWDLASPIGPLTAAESGAGTGAFATSLGLFTIGSGSNLSFTAEVPEPGGVLFFGSMLSGVIALWRVRVRSCSKGS